MQIHFSEVMKFRKLKLFGVVTKLCWYLPLFDFNFLIIALGNTDFDKMIRYCLLECFHRIKYKSF